MNVARSEGQLLTLTRALMDGTHPSVIAPLLAESHPLGKKIGPTAMEILQSTLAKGAVLTLVKNSGWKVEKRIRGDELIEGRLWERHEAPELRFSSWSFALLRLVLTNQLMAEAGSIKPPEKMGNGDHILALLVARALITLDLGIGLKSVSHSPLVQLAYPWYVKEHEVDWKDFLASRTWMIEGLRDLLSEAWVTAERAKITTRAPGRVVAGSERQDNVLHGYLDAIEALGRQDLTDFLLHAGERLIPNAALPPELGARSLDPTTPLRDRMAAKRASTAFLGALLRCADIHRHDRGVRFFDDDYDAAQERMKRWETFSDARVATIRTMRELLMNQPG